MRLEVCDAEALVSLVGTFDGGETASEGIVILEGMLQTQELGLGIGDPEGAIGVEEHAVVNKDLLNVVIETDDVENRLQLVNSREGVAIVVGAGKVFFTQVLAIWFAIDDPEIFAPDLAETFYQDAALPFRGFANADVV